VGLQSLWEDLFQAGRGSSLVRFGFPSFHRGMEGANPRREPFHLSRRVGQVGALWHEPIQRPYQRQTVSKFWKMFIKVLINVFWYKYHKFYGNQPKIFMESSQLNLFEISVFYF
jgi:hypothetical protein